MNGKVSCIHGLEDKIVDMFTIPKAIYKFNYIPIKTHQAFFFFFYSNRKQTILNFRWKHKRYSNLKKEQQNLQASYVQISKHISNLQ